jgi:hypothetical protein
VRDDRDAPETRRLLPIVDTLERALARERVRRRERPMKLYRAREADDAHAR